MKAIVRKISGFLFILLGFTPLLFSLCYTLKQQSIRHRMKEKMEVSLLHTISVADNEIHWVKEGKEIWIHGKMFDIKSAEHRDGITIFHGLYDDDETVLKKNFDEGRKKNMSEQNQLLARLFQSLQGVYFTQSDEIWLLSKNQHYLFFSLIPGLLSQSEDIPTPPPQG